MGLDNFIILVCAILLPVCMIGKRWCEKNVHVRYKEVRVCLKK